jgi:hypothetical protein
MARKKGKAWQAEEPEVATAEPEVQSEPEVAPDPVLSLDQAKSIVNSAVQPLAPGEEARPKPSPELLDAAKAIVNAAVQPKAPA